MPDRRRAAWVLAAGLAAAFLVWAGPSGAETIWAPYANARFCYGVEIPPGFAFETEADNGDGATLSSAESGARLAVWGANIVEGNFRSEAAGRADSYISDGWQLSLRRIGDARASLSGSRKDRVLYVRGIDLGDGQAAYFELDYPRAGLQAFDPVVERLVRSLAKAKGCSAR